MTRRTRLESKLSKRQEWSASASRKSSAAFSSAAKIADGIPLGQPVLRGHHSEKHHRRDLARIDSGMRKGCELQHKAEDHSSKADGIQQQLDRSIFSDDQDAIPALEARIAEHEAARERLRLYNASCRKAAKAGEKHGDLSLLSEAQKEDLATLLRVCPYQVRDGGAFPAYASSNLSGRIKADRDRIEQIRRQAVRTQAAVDSGGIKIIRHPEANWCTITFQEKPDRDIIADLKSAGYRWGGGSWSGRLDQLPGVIVEMERYATEHNVKGKKW